MKCPVWKVPNFPWDELGAKRALSTITCHYFVDQVEQGFEPVKKDPSKLGGGFKYFLFSPLLGEDSHFD